MSSASGRRRANVRQYSAEDQALNQISVEAESRLAAKRAARAEAREIRMKEIEKQQKEAEEREERGNDTTSTAKINEQGSRRGSGDSTESDSTKDLKDRNYKHELRELEIKYKNTMMTNAQLDNEKQSLIYQVELLKDEFEEHEEGYLELQREYKAKCSEFEMQKRELREMMAEHSLMKSQVEYLDKLLKENGLVIITAESGEMSLEKDKSSIPAGPISMGAALLSAETIEILKKAGEGSLGTPINNSPNVLSGTKGSKSNTEPAREPAKEAIEIQPDSVISENNSEQDKQILLALEKDTKTDLIDGNVLGNPPQSITERESSVESQISSSVDPPELTQKQTIELGKGFDPDSYERAGRPGDSRESTVESTGTKGSHSEGDPNLDQYSEDASHALESDLPLEEHIPSALDAKTSNPTIVLTRSEHGKSVSDVDEFFDAPSSPMVSPFVSDTRFNVDKNVGDVKSNKLSQQSDSKSKTDNVTLDESLFSSFVEAKPDHKPERKKRKSQTESDNLGITLSDHETKAADAKEIVESNAKCNKGSDVVDIASSLSEVTKTDAITTENTETKSKKNKKKNKKQKQKAHTEDKSKQSNSNEKPTESQEQPPSQTPSSNQCQVETITEQPQIENTSNTSLQNKAEGSHKLTDPQSSQKVKGKGGKKKGKKQKNVNKDEEKQDKNEVNSKPSAPDPGTVSEATSVVTETISQSIRDSNDQEIGSVAPKQDEANSSPNATETLMCGKDAKTMSDMDKSQVEGPSNENVAEPTQGHDEVKADDTGQEENSSDAKLDVTFKNVDGLSESAMKTLEIGSSVNVSNETSYVQNSSAGKVVESLENVSGVNVDEVSIANGSRVKVDETSDVGDVKVDETTHKEEVKVDKTSHKEDVKVDVTSEVGDVKVDETSHLDDVKVDDTSYVDDVKVDETIHLDDLKVDDTSCVEDVKVDETSHVKDVKVDETSHVKDVKVDATSNVEDVNENRANSNEDETFQKGNMDHVFNSNTDEIPHAKDGSGVIADKISQEDNLDGDCQEICNLDSVSQEADGSAVKPDKIFEQEGINLTEDEKSQNKDRSGLKLPETAKGDVNEDEKEQQDSDLKGDESVSLVSDEVIEEILNNCDEEIENSEPKKETDDQETDDPEQKEENVENIQNTESVKIDILDVTQCIDKTVLLNADTVKSENIESEPDKPESKDINDRTQSITEHPEANEDQNVDVSKVESSSDKATPVISSPKPSTQISEEKSPDLRDQAAEMLAKLQMLRSDKKSKRKKKKSVDESTKPQEDTVSICSTDSRTSTVTVETIVPENTENKSVDQRESENVGTTFDDATINVEDKTCKEKIIMTTDLDASLEDLTGEPDVAKDKEFNDSTELTAASSEYSFDDIDDILGDETKADKPSHSSSTSSTVPVTDVEQRPPKSPKDERKSEKRKSKNRKDSSEQPTSKEDSKVGNVDKGDKKKKGFFKTWFN